MPDMGLMYYNVPDMGIVPPLQEGNKGLSEKAGKGDGRAWNHFTEIPTSVGSSVLPVK